MIPTRPKISRVEWILAMCGRIRSRIFTALLAKGFGRIGSKVTINPPLRFANLGQIHLGSDIIIARDCWIQAIACNGDEGSEGKLVIDSGACIGMNATLSAAESVHIGANTLLARNVYISDHGHSYETVGTAIKNQGIGMIRPVRIGRGSWLGQNVCVLPGVEIGEHCVIGANSVVTKDIPAYSVAVGAPARVIRQYDHVSTTWDRLPILNGQHN